MCDVNFYLSTPTHKIPYFSVLLRKLGELSETKKCNHRGTTPSHTREKLMSTFLGGAHDSDICDITNKKKKRMQTTTNRRTLQQLTFARGWGSILLICSMWIHSVLEDALAWPAYNTQAITPRNQTARTSSTHPMLFIVCCLLHRSTANA